MSFLPPRVPGGRPEAVRESAAANDNLFQSTTMTTRSPHRYRGSLAAALAVVCLSASIQAQPVPITAPAGPALLKPAFTPRNEDGEVVDFRLASVAEVAEWIGDADGPHVVTADASLVIVDWLLRHGHVTPAHAAFAALDALRVATHPPSAR